MFGPLIVPLSEIKGCGNVFLHKNDETKKSPALHFKA